MVKQLPNKLECLVDSNPRPWNNLGTLPQKGIYVFYENGSPLYVGRTNRMRDRLKEHGRQSSGHNKAPFAFNIAKNEANKLGLNVNGSRKDLGNKPEFIFLFQSAKQRVSEMSVRVIPIDDQIIQTLFEVYAAIALGTLYYNSFDNH